MTARIALAVLFAALVGAAGCSAGGGGASGTPEGPGAPAVAAPETPRTTSEADVSADDTARTDGSTGETRPSAQTEEATFGAGCFWCVEAVLEQLDGVIDVSSGYMGGQVANPTYQQVCSGSTGHAEVVQVTFDPAVVSYDTLLNWFWKLHDPTTLNRQGADVGTQYRSAIFVHSDAQRATAERSKEKAQASFERPIVTEITDASTYYPAEDYHQDYYRLNSRQGYCRAVIAPKLNKLGLDDHTDN